MKLKFLCAAFLATACLFLSSISNPLLADMMPDDVLIDAETLKSWQDRGLLECEESNAPVVLLDVTDPQNYATGHIPGAQLLNVADQVQTRVEGPAPTRAFLLCPGGFP